MSITSMPATALRLLKLYGKTMSYTGVIQGAYDPTTGTTSTAETTLTMKALIQDYQRQADGAAFVSGLVLEGDKKITVAAASFTTTPVPGDKLAFGLIAMTVKNVKTTYAGEVPALYELHARN